MAVHFAAEVSSNHNRSLKRCLEFIDQAAMINCTSVKFQLFRIDDLFIPEVIANRPDIKQRKQWELPVDFLPHLAERCREKGVTFGCTPFYLKAVEVLYPYVDYYKIASYELLWSDLLKECAGSKKPITLSTGMATMEEVDRAVHTIRESGGEDLTLLHCASAYPASAKSCNLAAMDTMRKQFKLPVGWSDHSVQPAVIQRAVHRWQASMVEFHLDLEGQGEEFASGHCWLPGQIESVIAEINLGFTADGRTIKEPAPEEMIERSWRADPVDGLRPLQETRRSINNDGKRS